jgi:transposase-like protein
LTKLVEAWKLGDMSCEDIKYLFADGPLFSMRIAGSIDKEPVLIAVSVTEAGHRPVLRRRDNDKESTLNGY